MPKKSERLKTALEAVEEYVQVEDIKEAFAFVESAESYKDLVSALGKLNTACEEMTGVVSDVLNNLEDDSDDE